MSSDSRPQDCAVLSRALHTGMVAYDLKPTEILLLLILCGETYDRDQVRAKADLPRFAKMLGCESMRKFDPHWRELINLKIVDFNAGQGTFELRPDYNGWSRMRGMRIPENLIAGPELGLVMERPLDESLSSLSREAARVERPNSTSSPAGYQPSSDAKPDDYWKGQYDRLREAISRGTATEEFPEEAKPPPNPGKRPDNFSEAEKLSAAENSAGARKPPAAENSAARQTVEKAVFAPEPENFSGDYSPNSNPLAIASLALSTKTKLVKGAAEFSAGAISGRPASAMRWLVEVDRRKRLEEERCYSQWQELCIRDPNYVLQALKWTYNDAKRRLGESLDDPIAYLARRCREERKFG